MTVKFLASRQGKQPEIAGRAGPLGAMATRQALQALEMLIDVRAVQSAVMPVNWAEWDRSYPGFTSANYLSLLATQSDGPLQEKKSHAKLRTDILSGTPSARRAQVQSYLVEQVSGILKLPAASVELDKRLSDMGLDSLMSVELKGQIDAALGVSVASARVIQGPTVVELTDCVMELLKEPEQAKATESANVPRLVQTLAEPPGGDLPALYFCYYVTSARVMAKHLSPKRPIRILQTHYDLDLQKWQEANELDITLEELAARSVAALRQAQPHGPYYLAGYCAGGNLAFEIAQQLTRQGEEVALLVLLDAFYEPGLRRLSAPRIRRWGFHLKRFLRYRSDYVTLKFKRRRERKKRLLAAAQRKASGLPDPEMTEAEKTRKLYNRFIETVLRKYKGTPYGGPMVLLRGIASPDFNISESYGWEQLMTGDFRVEEMLITHAQFEEEEHLQEIAKWLDRELAAADVRLARK
jgi:thioesterase domain-containing protein/acyl carrier protein